MENSVHSSGVETLRMVADGQAEALEFIVRAESQFLDVPLKALKLKDSVLVASIIRRGKCRVPSGNDAIELGDRVVVVTTTTVCIAEGYFEITPPQMETRRFPTGERRVFARACAKASTGTRTPCFGGENVVESDAMNTTTLTFEQRYVQARDALLRRTSRT